MALQPIHTDQAPAAIGTYSQAVRAGNWLFLSGQIPLDPQSMALVGPDPRQQIEQVFLNLKAVCRAAGTDFSHVAKLTVYLTDLGHFPLVNEIMGRHFHQPYPARAAVGVSALPKGAAVEMDAIVALD